MEDNSVFRIPTNSHVSDLQNSSVQPVELESTSITFESQKEKDNNISLYEELTAISEEVIACRNTVLERI